MTTLYLVATPIGNLEDMTFRAVRVLSEVGVIAAEDTRTARRLLTHFQIRGRLLSYTEHNRRSRIPQILALLNEQSVALVSEAGMPAISDPGQELVAAATVAGHTVTAVPGASAVLAAVAISGLSTRSFLFLGFLPRKQGERRSLLRSLDHSPSTLIFFEAPSRVRATLADLLACLGDRHVAVCRELTKLHEEVIRSTISAALAAMQEPRGEFTVVVEGAGRTTAAPSPDEIQARLRELKARGMTARDGADALAAEFEMPRRQAYSAWHAFEG